MQALRPVLQRRLLSAPRPHFPPATLERKPFPLLRRLQHNQNDYGPHKEYFQTPGQTPLPDTTPYDPREPVQAVPVEAGSSHAASAFRGIVWGVLFSLFGVASGTAFITWEYMQPPYEPGSPEELDLLEEIEELLNAHPVVQSLRDEGWTEEDFYARSPSDILSDRARGRNLAQDTLRGSSQTLNIKLFRREETQTTFLVFFVGFGLDGFPDVLHGGVTATMMLESLNKHMAYHHRKSLPHETNTPDFDQMGMDITYKQPVRPGEIYTVMVAPGSLEPDPKNIRNMRVSVAALLLRLDELPKMSSHWDPAKRTMEHRVEVQSSTGDSPYMASAQFYVPVLNRSESQPPIAVPSNSIATEDGP